MNVDVFMFDDEFDMLDCRLYQLRGVVDRFIAIEGDHTMSGIAKPFHLTERLNGYSDVPLEVVRVNLGGVDGNWERDHAQRDGATDLVAALPPDAVVMFGDLDEIPRPEVFTGFDGVATALPMRHLVYSVRWRHPGGWLGGIIGRRDQLPLSAQAARMSRRVTPELPEAGWHLSWFGTAEEKIRKLRHFAHSELIPTIGDRVGTELPAQHLHVDGTPLVPYDGDLPAWVADGHAPEYWF